jgi:hypothetical protein
MKPKKRNKSQKGGGATTRTKIHHDPKLIVRERAETKRPAEFEPGYRLL